MSTAPSDASSRPSLDASSDAGAGGVATLDHAPPLGRGAGAPAGRRRGRRGSPGSVLWAAGVMAAAIAVAALSWKLPHQRDFFDFRIYWAATRAWFDGTPLYSFEQPHTAHLGFTYPPFAGLVLAPFSFVPVSVAAWLLCAISLAVLTGVAIGIGSALSGALGLPRIPAIVVTLALSLGIEPVRESLCFGQINIILLGLLVLDIWLILRGSPLAGIASGLAAALKLTPAILVLVMLARGLRASAVRALAAFGAVTLAALAMAPTASRQYWTDKMWDPNRVGVARRFANQSIAGVIARLQHHDRPSSAIWMLAVLAILAAIVLLVRAQRGPLADARALIIGAAGATAVSPISWSHHYVWAVPAFAMAVYDAIRLRARWRWAAIGLAYVGFAYGPVFINRYLRSWPADAVVQVRSMLYPAATLVLCGLIAWEGIRAGREQRAGGADGQRAGGADGQRAGGADGQRADGADGQRADQASAALA